MAGRLETYSEKVYRMYPRSSTFSIGLDAFGDFVPIMIVHRPIMMVLRFLPMSIVQIRQTDVALANVLPTLAPSSTRVSSFLGSKHLC